MRRRMIAALKRPPPWPPPGPARRCLLAAPATRQPWARQALLYSEDVGHGEGERPLRGHPAGRQGGAGPRQLALKDFACREPPGFRNVPEPWKKAGPRKLCTRRWARSSQCSAGHTCGGSLPAPARHLSDLVSQPHWAGYGPRGSWLLSGLGRGPLARAEDPGHRGDVNAKDPL